MAIKKCKECGESISSKAEKCPKCGHPNETRSIISAVVSLMFVGGLLWYFFGGGLEKHAAKELQKIEYQVALDQVEQYNIAKKQGDPIQKCVQAGMVSAAYLQANDSLNYNQWKEREKTNCRAAGMPE